MAKRWRFTEYTKEAPARWTWRLLSPDGSIEQQSGEFENYGAAVRDAIIRGFRPTQDHWIIESTHALVHYEHGKHSIVVPKADRNSRLVPPRAPRGTPARKRRFPEEEEKS